MSVTGRLPQGNTAARVMGEAPAQVAPEGLFCAGGVGAVAVSKVSDWAVHCAVLCDEIRMFSEHCIVNRAHAVWVKG